MNERYARALAFMRRGDMGGAREVASNVGVAVTDASRPLRHDSNYLVVERADATPDEVVAEVARLRLPMAMMPDEALGERIAAALVPRGWGVHRGLAMAHDRAPDRLASGVDVREVGLELLRGLRREALFAYPWATPEVADQLVDAKVGIAERVTVRSFAAFVEGEVVSYTDLFVDGAIAQVEDVATVPAHRNRGLARAVVLRAIDEARAGGAELVFLVASDEDWPKELYRKLGFDELGRYVKLMPPVVVQ